jgi:hypothetical protein
MEVLPTRFLSLEMDKVILRTASSPFCTGAHIDSSHFIYVFSIDESLLLFIYFRLFIFVLKLLIEFGKMVDDYTL